MIPYLKIRPHFAIYLMESWLEEIQIDPVELMRELPVKKSNLSKEIIFFGLKSGPHFMIHRFLKKGEIINLTTPKKGL